MTLRSRISVQSDWNQTVREGEGKFWLSYKPAEQGESVHADVEVRKEDSAVVLVPEDMRFHLHLSTNQRSLNVRFSADVDSEGAVTSRFIAASRVFSLADGLNNKITVLDVTNSGLGLSACESSSTVSIWESDSGEIRRRLVDKHIGDVYVAKFFPSGIVVATAGADTRINIWSAETGECAATITGHKAGVENLEFIERGRNIVTCSRDGTSKLWDVSKQACITSFPTDDLISGTVNCISVTQANSSLELGSSNCTENEFGTEGKVLLTGLESGLVHIYSLQSKSQMLTLEPGEGSVDCISMVGSDTIAVGTGTGAICLYDIRNTREQLYKSMTGRSGIKSLTKHKQGYIYSCGDGSAVVMDETLTLPVNELTGPDCDPVYKVRSTSGGTVYTSCRDGLVRTYNL